MKNIKKIIIGIGSLIIGLLGAWGGAEGTSKGWRRWGIPGFLTIIGLAFGNYWSPIILAWAGIFSLGYGIPGNGDEGSTLGRFWYKITGQNHLLADIFTKGTISIFLSIILAVIGLASGHLGSLVITVSLLIGSQLIFGGFWQIPGEFNFLGKKLTWNEFLRYLFAGFAGLIQIIGG